jgi:hypothetical protein
LVLRISEAAEEFFSDLAILGQEPMKKCWKQAGM